MPGGHFTLPLMPAETVAGRRVNRMGNRMELARAERQNNNVGTRNKKAVLLQGNGVMLQLFVSVYVADCKRIAKLRKPRDRVLDISARRRYV